MKLLRVREAADRLALSSRQVYRLIETGQLQAVKIDTATRIPDVVVEQFIEGKLLEAGISLVENREKEAV